MNEPIKTVNLTADDLFELKVARDRLRVAVDVNSRGKGARRNQDDERLLETLERILKQ